MRALAIGGALVLHTGAPFAHPDRVAGSLSNLRAVFSRVVPYYVHIPIYGSVWGFAVASEALDPRELTAAEVERRLQDRGIVDRQFYDGQTHLAMLALPGYIRTMIG